MVSNDFADNSKDCIEIFIIIPARSGSKGLVDKNIKYLDNKPLLQWTVEAINDAKLDSAFSVLSTDSPVYAERGLGMGLTVPFLRPVECADDKASALQVAQHALDWFERQYGYLPKWTMWLQPTSPFRSAAIIRQSVMMVVEHEIDAVVGCQEIHRDLTTLFRRENDFLIPLDRTKITQTSRQQSLPLLTPNGAMYLCKTTYLLGHKSFYPPKTWPLVMNKIQSLDIDTEEDWAMAEAFILQGLV